MTDQISFLPMLEPRDTSFEDNERKASQICDEEFERADGDIVKFNVRKNWGENVKQGQTLHTPQGWADVWDKVEYRCREKAEKYK